MGKTILLRGFVGLSEEAGVPSGYVETFARAFSSAPGLASLGARAVAGSSWSTPTRLWRPSAGGLAETPCRTSRRISSSSWRTDPGWQSLACPLRLENPNREESRAYLVRRDVPPEEHQNILGSTHGHPLALNPVPAIVLDPTVLAPAMPAGFLIEVLPSAPGWA